MTLRPSNEYGPLCRFELVAVDHKGSVWGRFQPAFPPRHTEERCEARDFAHLFVRDMEQRGYRVIRRRPSTAI